MRPLPFPVLTIGGAGMRYLELSDEDLRDEIRQSHFTVAQVLPKKKRIELSREGLC
jgi:hypothetical protein